jgi:hypothetical protein
VWIAEDVTLFPLLVFYLNKNSTQRRLFGNKPREPGVYKDEISAQAERALPSLSRAALPKPLGLSLGFGE